MIHSKVASTSVPPLPKVDDVPCFVLHIFICTKEMLRSYCTSSFALKINVRDLYCTSLLGGIAASAAD